MHSAFDIARYLHNAGLCLFCDICQIEFLMARSFPSNRVWWSKQSYSLVSEMCIDRNLSSIIGSSAKWLDPLYTREEERGQHKEDHGESISTLSTTLSAQNIHQRSLDCIGNSLILFPLLVIPRHLQKTCWMLTSKPWANMWRQKSSALILQLSSLNNYSILGLLVTSILLQHGISNVLWYKSWVRTQGI